MPAPTCMSALFNMVTKRAAQGIAECEHALALDRNLAQAHCYIGLGKIFLGRAQETEAHTAEALRLSPHDTLAYLWMYVAGMARLYLGRRSSRSVASAIDRIQSQFRACYFQLAAALAQLGRLDEAHSAVKAGLALHPTSTISRARAAWTAMSDDPTYLAQLEPIFEGLRKAGLPE